MWICKFKVRDKENLLRQLIEENKLEAYYYPINYYIKKNKYFFIAICLIKGSEENKKIFYNKLQKLKFIIKQRKIEELHREGDLLTIITSHTKNRESRKNIRIFYNPEIIQIKPIVFHKDGWEEWEIASINKKNIDKLIKTSENIYELELLKFYKGNIKNFGFLTILPDLTEKQDRALKLALEKGYYTYPRKISLDKLSKIAKLSFSTFQAHVRKAENKILSYIVSLN